MVNLSLSKEELDVVYYALKRFSIDARQSAETFQKATEVTGYNNPQFVAGKLRDSAIADKLSDDCIKLMLEMLKH